MDLATILGLLAGLGFVLAGHALQGGHMGSMLQPSAALIVFGGTFGAALVAFPRRDFARAMRMARGALTEAKDDLPALVQQLVELSRLARREGVLALETILGRVQDPFLEKALAYVVDGVDGTVTRSALEGAIDAEHDESMEAARVWEALGGYAPTIGIIGAVLGLIHVMENLSDPSRLGGGIAVAFVATIYGVGSANLVYLPIASKLKRRIRMATERQLLIAEGVLAIQEGLNPRVLEEKLRALARERPQARQAARKAA